MSFLSDKSPCSDCGQLYDLDMLNWQNVCRDCVLDNAMTAELNEDYSESNDDDEAEAA